MAQSLVDFTNLWNGKFNNYDGGFGPQCVDIVNQYVVDVLGIASWRGNAVDKWTNYPKDKFTAIPASPTLQLKAGDIICWGKEISNGLGHVAIAMGAGGLANFTSFDQNWPSGSACHFQTHTAKGIVGVLRPKTTAANSQYMKFDLLQKEGDPTVYFRVWPVVTGDSVLYPIQNPEQLINYFGPDAWSKIQKVKDFAGQGITLQDLVAKN